MRNRIVLIVILFCLVRFSAPVFVQPDTRILVGGLELRLGMTQEAALESLGRVYELRHLDDSPGNWVVVRRGGLPLNFVGSLSFAKGRLILASNHWSSVDSDGGRTFASNVINALRTVSGGSCLINDTVNDKFSSVTLKCAQREFSITTGEQVSSSVQETIRMAR
jgi:hypothetical protein